MLCKAWLAHLICLRIGTDFVDLSGELDWSDNEADEIQLHRNMAALVGGMVNGGLIDAEDLEEEV